MDDCLNPTKRIFVNFMENPEIVAFDKEFIMKDLENSDEDTQF
jgi:hypothetical protein